MPCRYEPHVWVIKFVSEELLRNSSTHVPINGKTGEIRRRKAAGPFSQEDSRVPEEQAEVIAAFHASGVTLRTSRAADEWVGLHFGT